MKINPVVAGTVAGSFVFVATCAQGDDLHYPPGNVPLTLSVYSTGVTSNLNIYAPTFYRPFNAVHDADYTQVADTTPLRLDGQTQKV